MNMSNVTVIDRDNSPRYAPGPSRHQHRLIDTPADCRDCTVDHIRRYGCGESMRYGLQVSLRLRLTVCFATYLRSIS